MFCSNCALIENILHTTSLTLLQKLRIQDPDGWERYTKLYLPLLYKWLKNMGISEEDAQDICQEVFINTYTSLSSFEHHGKGSFRKWLRTIVNRRISDHYRKKEKDSPVVPIKGSGPQEIGKYLKSCIFQQQLPKKLQRNTRLQPTQQQ